MSKGERISRLVAELVGREADAGPVEVATHSFYRAFFRCWNEQRYYEAHDVLEQLWLKTASGDADFFKGLIQAAGAFIHLQKNFEHPSHPKHGRRLQPAVRLFQLAEKNLAPYTPVHHAFNVDKFLKLLRQEREKIARSNFQTNPWSPQAAPKLKLLL
jgi:predicted metal-dependent hydrolase